MLWVEIAETPTKLAQGLMFRPKVPEDTGMLFMFHTPQKLRFWGRNTLVPLDIAFIDSNDKISKISRIKSMSDHVVMSEADCVMAIEANVGYFEVNKIKVGHKIEVKRMGKNACILFLK